MRTGHFLCALVVSVVFIAGLCLSVGAVAAAPVPGVEEVPLGALGVLPAPLAMPAGTPDMVFRRTAAPR